MANQYPTSATAVATDSAGRRTTTTTNYSYASPVVAKTANYQVLGSDSGTEFTTVGAAGEVDFTLPPPANGLQYTFIATAAFVMKVIGGSGTLKGPGGLNGGAAAGTTLTVSAGTVANQYTQVRVVSDGTSWFFRINGTAALS